MALRAAELEILYTANTAGVEQGEKKVKESAQRVESKPVVQKIDGDARAALQDISRVKTQAEDLVAAHRVVQVDSDTSEALAGMDRVEAQAKQLVSERAVLALDAKVDGAVKALERAKAKVEDLSILANSGFDVTADTKRAEAALSRAEQQLDRLRTARANVEVEADTTKAIANLGKLEDAAKQAGERAGGSGGSSFVSSLDGATRGAGERVGSLVGGEVEDSLVSALTAIPIAGGIVLAGVAIGKAITGAIQDGLQQEVGFDRLEALTGINPGQAMRIGRAAGEAYANVFGDSIEANLDTARLAVQFNLIDPRATTSAAQKVIEGLSGISEVLQEDVGKTAESTTVLLRTGLAKSAQEAFDILAAGARNGVNRSGDLLDSLTEYPTIMRELGLSGKEYLGLLSEGMKAGARNSDLVADGLKELQLTLRNREGADALKQLGLNADDTYKAFAEGGPAARAGLEEILTGMRNIEDPVQRNQVALGLFKTKAEDLGDALYALDLTNAVDQLGLVDGAAQKMFDTLSNNDATKIEQAGRNIEVAADGIKGALAAGFAEPLADVAEFVSRNRGPVLEFFLGLANGALDFGESMVEGAATSTEALGTFVSGPLADATEGVAVLLRWLQQYDEADGVQGLADQMRGFDDQTQVTADSIRDLGNGAIEEARQKLNQFGEGAVAMGFLNDASLNLADALDKVGKSAGGSVVELSDVEAANIAGSDAGEALQGQILNVAAALDEQLGAAERNKATQAELTEKYNTTRDALISQIEQMGLGRDAAAALVDEVLRTPEKASTAFSSNAPEQKQKVQDLATRIETLPDGSVVIRANTAPADESIGNLFRKWDGATVNLRATGDGRLGSGILGAGYHGGVVDFMASGGIPDLTPMSSVAAVIPANTWRVVGDRPDVAEAFIPLDGSPRSLGILAESFRRMPGLNVDTTSGRGGNSITISMQNQFKQDDPILQARALGRELRSALSSS